MFTGWTRVAAIRVNRAELLARQLGSSRQPGEPCLYSDQQFVKLSHLNPQAHCLAAGQVVACGTWLLRAPSCWQRFRLLRRPPRPVTRNKASRDKASRDKATRNRGPAPFMER